MYKVEIYRHEFVKLLTQLPSAGNLIRKPCHANSRSPPDKTRQTENVHARRKQKGCHHEKSTTKVHRRGSFTTTRSVKERRESKREGTRKQWSSTPDQRIRQERSSSNFLLLYVVVSTVDSTLSVTHFRAHAGIDRGLDTEVLAVLARSALSASSHLLGLSPLAASAALEGRAVDAVPGTFGVARSGLGRTRRAGAGTGAGRSRLSGSGSTGFRGRSCLGGS